MKEELVIPKKKNSNSKNTKKIIINSKEDLIKIPFSTLKNTEIFDFGGKYFDLIYNRALGIEQNIFEKESLNKQKSQKNKESNINSAKIKKNITHQEGDDIISQKNSKKKEKNNSFYYSQQNSNYNKIINDMNIDAPSLKIEKIIFQMKYNTVPGEDLGVLGSIQELGNWDQNRALRLGWNDGNIWKTTINYDFSKSNDFEFKFIFILNGRVKQWEDGNNRKISFEYLKQNIEPKIKEGSFVELKNIKGSNLLYNDRDHSLTIICEWNKK